MGAIMLIGTFAQSGKNDVKNVAQVKSTVKINQLR